MWSPQPDKRSYQGEWDKKHEVSGIHRPAEDPHSSGANTWRGLQVSPQICFGRIVDGVAYTHCYRVLLEGRPPLPCTLLTGTSLLPVGARDISTFVPGTAVWVITHPQLPYGLIIGAEPNANTDSTQAFSDFIHGSSRCGLRTDQTHYSISTLDQNGTVSDWSAGRPFDSTLAGEWGAITETGLKITLDSFMAQLGADEATGVTAFYHDQLLRVAGYNMQVSTAFREEDWLDDQGEAHGYIGSTPYPWEHRGVFNPSADPFRDLTDQQSQIDEPYYGGVEPLEDDQMSFHRVVSLSGYLGQGGKRMVLQPPTDSPVWQYSTTSLPTAVFEEDIALTGRYMLRSAMGIHFAKRPAIPGPKRMVRAEDASGDTEENYLFAGLLGSGAQHVVSGTIIASTPDSHLQQAAAVPDGDARAFNWEAEHPLYYHTKDWSVPDEADTKLTTNQVPVGFAALASQCYLPPAATATIYVDHRYQNVTYCLNESRISLLDDGGIALDDGFGASIRMTAGTLTLSAPGDIMIKSGRTTSVWSGFDTILRANNCTDISSTNKSVRIKADTDVQILAGNSGSVGAVLIESKAGPSYNYADVVGDDVQAGGIQLKTATGEIVQWASNIYLRTGGGDVSPGTITLDAARGQAPITVYASDFLRYLGNTAVDYFGLEGAITSANLYDSTVTLLGGELVINGFTEVLQGGFVVNGNIEVAAGHIFTELSPQYDGLVGEVIDRSLEQLHMSLQQGAGSTAAIVTDGVKSWKQAFLQYWYGPGRPGADTVISTVGFSFRSQEQYGTEDFRIYEDRWQQFARLTSGAPATWTEKPVASGSFTTYPYPGQEKLSRDMALLEQDLVLYDQTTGTSKARTPDLYGAPKYATPTPKVLNGNYAVIM